MTPSTACSKLVEGFEGCVLKAYPDPATHGDPWTIGIGHTGPEVHQGLVWTQEQAESALQADLNHVAVAVTSLINGQPTTQNQFDAMVSLTFNIGIGNFSSSTLLKMHKARLYDQAAAQFLRWDKAAGHVMKGLQRRRQAEMEMYRGR